jgi:crossover junction endodeoxyribonuclease RusA
VTNHSFAHDGKPKPKERPRAGRNGRIYTPKTTLDAQAELAASYDGPLFEGPVGIGMNFYPDRTHVLIWDWPWGVSPLRGDIDNYAKLPLDALEGVAFLNDRQVMSIYAEKRAA